MLSKGHQPGQGAEPVLTDTAIREGRYWSPEFADLEADALWPRVWQVAGRVDQIPDPGEVWLGSEVPVWLGIAAASSLTSILGMALFG